MENYGSKWLLEIRDPGGEMVLGISDGVARLTSPREADRQCALDLLFNALAAVSQLTPPYAMESTRQTLDQAHEASAHFGEVRLFVPYEIPPESPRGESHDRREP